MNIETGGSNKTMIAALVALIIIGFGAWRYMSQKKAGEMSAPQPIKTAEDVVSAVTSNEIEVGSNPVENKIPEVNPVDRANPFKDAYKNPFK